jgi:hypothetical protein
MADFNSSLPVRTQNNGDVVVNISDGTTETQKLAVDASGRITVKTDDGAGNPLSSTLISAAYYLNTYPAFTALTGGTASTYSALVAGTYNTSLPTLTAGEQGSLQLDSSGRLIISPLSSSSTVTALQGTTPWVENLTQVGGSAIALGQTTMSASLPVTIASNQSALNVLNTANGSVAGGTAGTQSLLAGLVYNTTAPTLTNGQQAALQGDVNGNLKVNLETAIPAGSNLIGGTNVYVGGSIATVSNPLPVTITSSTPGTAVQNYQTSAALAAGSSVTLTYTVAASHTFSLERVWTSASGKIKSVVAYSGNTAFVGFNSTANPNIDMTFMAPPTIAAAGTVTVTITNDDLSAFDVYATIEGNQN